MWPRTTLSSEGFFEPFNIEEVPRTSQFHYHLREEEHIFILKGSATLVLGNNRYVMNERATAASRQVSGADTIW